MSSRMPRVSPARASTPIYGTGGRGSRAEIGEPEQRGEQLFPSASLAPSTGSGRAGTAWRGPRLRAGCAGATLGASGVPTRASHPITARILRALSSAPHEPPGHATAFFLAMRTVAHLAAPDARTPHPGFGSFAVTPDSKPPPRSWSRCVRSTRGVTAVRIISPFSAAGTVPLPPAGTWRRGVVAAA
jgi:hypothetical protein